MFKSKEQNCKQVPKSSIIYHNSMNIKKGKKDLFPKTGRMFGNENQFCV